ncbi:MAG: tRNA uridine-5-carboxymethylaminomethyl(34) synthesis GTPase MnmE, partial [Bacteroidaceae bacterium]|nr:tRNA uridine-5-carboxymethylaminomethyl(34) synthesis GTPase MnmE [Bacteroidaceae bacterium]
MTELNDTICAVATRAGGAIGVVRVSGPDAIRLTDSIFRSVSKHPLASAIPYTLCYGQIVDGTGAVIDDVLVSVFRAPRSFTGQDSTEISCHGSSYILQQVCRLLIDAGCRQAEPGEYTQRAFLAGKMDLSQAEAVADLIASTSAASHRLAMNQMKGGFSRELRSLRDQLLQFTSLIELELDFSEEDVEFADRSQLEQLAEQIEQVITRLADSFSTGDAIRNGVPVAIIGQTNTGKSTLLNQLLHDDRALVSDIQGTTRDSIEDTTTIDGVLFRFIDTAGIRQTTDTVESMGIERSYRKAREASIILWMTDEAHPADAETEKTILELAHGKHLIRVHNKCDDASALPAPTDTDVWISAKYGHGLQQLNDFLVKAAAIPEISEQDVIVTNMRHYESLVKAQECILRVRQGLKDRISGDFLSQDIRQCIHHLSQITGDITTDDILGNIFSHFC